jgi:hypothetical protein
MKNLDSLKQHGDLIWSIANLLRVTAATTSKIDVRHGPLSVHP